MAITHEKMRDLIVTVNYMIARCVSEPDGLSNEHYKNCGEIKDILHEAAQPAAQERKYGHWRKHLYVPVDKLKDWDHQCSECGRFHEYVTDFCPWCGAQMYEKVGAAE